MDAIQVLRNARDLWLEHPTKDNIAIDGNGHIVHATSEEAVCWCALGAICKVAKVKISWANPVSNTAREALEHVTRRCGLGDIPDANDNGTLTREHWDTAIRNLGGEP